MSKRTWLAAGGSLLAATIGLLGAAGGASASTSSRVVGYTYIDGNTATANTIDGFARHADGSVTPLPGSPFAAGGAGTGAGLASQGAIQAIDGGRYLLAVDAGSNQISVLHITRGGVPVSRPSRRRHWSSLRRDLVSHADVVHFTERVELWLR